MEERLFVFLKKEFFTFQIYEKKFGRATQNSLY